MEETTQLNLRFSKALIYDMEFIASKLKISRNDWLKVKISELISQEKLKIMETIEDRFIAGKISEEEFSKTMGFKPTEDMKKLRDKVRLSAKTYLQDIAKKIEK